MQDVAQYVRDMDEFQSLGLTPQQLGVDENPILDEVCTISSNRRFVFDGAC